MGKISNMKKTSFQKTIYFLFLISILSFINLTFVYGQTTVVNMTISEGATQSLLANNAGSIWGGTGLPYLSTTANNKERIFDSGLSGAGLWVVTVLGGSDDKQWNITVTATPPPTSYNMTGGGSYCLLGTGVTVGLDDSDVGIDYELYLDGVTTGTVIAGTGGALNYGLQTIAGDYTVIATHAILGLQSSMIGSSTVIINPLPTINIPADYGVCNGSSTTLTATGNADTYTWDNGVTNGVVFSPVATINYTVTADIVATGCQATDNVTITVYSDPGVSFLGLVALHCDTDFPADAITGFPIPGALESATFSGSGITNTGAGTADFDPQTSGLGTHNITYEFTDAGGCVWSDVQISDVGVLLTMNGLASSYCYDDILAKTITCTPAPNDILTDKYTALNGLTDNNDGTATLTPSLTDGPATYTVEYSYVGGGPGPIGCTNTITQSTTIFAAPTPTISGLAATYCNNVAAVTLTGNYAPAGTFSGPGITDLGNGTATFDPSAAGTGPVIVTYEYTNGGGCYESVDGNTTILVAPTATISGDATICSGDNTPIDIVFTGSQPFNFTYTDGTTPVTPAPNATNNYNTNVSPTSAAGTTTTTYTVTTVSDATGCSSVGLGSAVVDVNSSPIANAGLDKEACLNSILTLTGSASSGDGTYDYSWTTGAAVASTIFTVTADVIHVLTVTDGNGCIDTDDVDVTMNDLPTIVSIIPSDVSFCLGNTSTLDATAVAAGAATISTYSWVDASTLNNGGAEDPIATPTAPGDNTYTLTVTDSKGCQNSAGTTLDVKALPVLTINSTANPVCSGSLSILSGGSDKTVASWEWDATGVTPTATIGNYNVNPVGSPSYDLTVIDTDGCTATESYVVNTNSLPLANSGGNKVMCFGVGVTLNGSASGGAGGYGYSWTSGDNIASTNVNPAANETYTLTVTDLNGCQDTDDAIVTVNALPLLTPIVTGADPICLGASTTLDAGAAFPVDITNYAWTNAGTLSSGGVFNPTATPIVSGINTYDVTITDINGCQNTASTTVDVKALPVLTINSSANPICSGSLSTLSGNSDKTVDNWYWDANAPTVSATIGTYGVNPLINTSYDLTVEDTDGCISTASYLVNTNSLPVANAGGLQEICDGESITLNGSATGGGGGYGYSWTTGDNTPNTTVSPGINTTYTLTVDDVNGCIDTDDADVVVNALPTVTPNTVTSPICLGLSSVINANAAPAGLATISSYLWTNSGTLTSGAIASPTATPIVSGINTYSVTVTDSKGCINTASTDITVLPAPSISISSAANPICRTDVATLSASSDKTITSWSWDGGASITSNYVVSPANSTTYSLTVIDNETCTNTATFTLNVNPLPLVNAGGDQTICYGETITLDGFASGTGPLSYFWSNSEITEDITVTLTATETFQLTVTDANTCQNSDEVDVTVNPLPVLSFTIDGDDSQDNGLNFCDNGSPVTLVGSGASNNIFSGNGVAGSSFNPVVAGVGTHIITYQHTDANGCSNTLTSKPVEVLATPVVNIIGLNAQYCENDAIFTISGNSPTGATLETFTFPVGWTAGNEYTDLGGGSFDIDPEEIALTGTGTYNITYEVTDNNGCIISTTESTDILPLPSVDFSGLPAIVAPATNAVICNDGGVLNLTGSPAVGAGNFSGSGVTNSGTTATFDPSGLTPGDYDITYEFTDGNSCVNSVTKTISVLAVPNKYVISGANTYCEGIGGVVIGLSNSQANIEYDLILNGSVSQIVETPGAVGAFDFNGSALYPAGVYSVTATSTVTGCFSIMNNTLTVTETPNAGDAGSISGTQNVCPDGSTLYTYTIAAISNANGYVWTVPVNASISANTGTSINVIYPNNAVSGNITVKGTSATCSDGAVNNPAFVVTVETIPTLSGGELITGQAEVCQGSTNIAYSVAGILNADSYAWTVPSTASIVSGQGTDNILVNFPADCISGNISVVGSSPCGVASAPVSKPITLVETPDVSIIAPGINDVITCAGNTVTLNASSTEIPANITGWLWTASSGGVLSGVTNAISANVIKEGDFTVQIEYTNGAAVCYNTATVAVNADKTAPNAAITTINPLITCDNEVAGMQLQATSNYVNSSFSWSAPAPIVIVAGANSDAPTVDTPGNYTVTVTNIDNSCTDQASITVGDDRVYPNVAVTSPSLDILNCVNGTARLEGGSTTPGVTYLWTTLTGGSIVNSTDPLLATGDITGVYTLEVTDPTNGCVSTDDVQVNEDQTIPTITSLVNNDGVNLSCNNGTVQLQAAVGGIPTATFTWSAGPGTIDFTSGTNNQFAEVSAIGTYTATATHPISKCTDTEQITITYDNSKPILNINSVTTVIDCNNPTIDLDASASTNAINYNWVAGAGGNIISGGATDVATISAAGTYTLTAEHAVTGCTETDVITITDNLAAPAVSVTGGPYFITCTDATPVLSATADAGTSILWTGPGTATINNANTLNPDVNVSGNYTVTATAANGCSSQDNVTVTADNSPPNISVNTNPNDITCTNPTVQISGNSTTAGTSYLWTELTLNGVVITNANTSIATVNGDGNFRLTVTGLNGCTNTSNVTVVENIIPPNLTVPAFEPEVLTCTVNSATLGGASTTPGALFSWTPAVGGVIITNPTSPTPIVYEKGDYNVVVTDPVNGCTTNGTTTVTENIGDKPTIIITPVAQQITCTTTSFALDASSSLNAINYTWTASNGGNILSNASTANPVINAAGTYTVTAEHPTTGCTEQASVNVTSDGSVPNIIINPVSDLTCNTTSITITADDPALGGETFAWTTSDGNITSGAATANADVNQPGTYLVTVTNSSNGCSSQKSVVVAQNITPPTVSIAAPLDLTCTITSVNLNATASSIDLSPLTFSWVPLGTGTIVSGATNPLAVVSAIDDYELTVTDQGNGCTNTATVAVSENKAVPDVTVDTSPDQITCDIASVQLSGLSTADVTYNWTGGPGVITGSALPNPSVDAAGTYALKVTDNINGCSNTSVNVIVTQNKVTPTVTVNAPSGQLTCLNSTVDISVTGNVNYSFNWTGPGVINNPTSNLTSVDAIGTYQVVIEDIFNGCTNTYTTDVTDDKVADNSPVISDIETCFGAANPSFNVTVGNTVNWYKDVAMSVFLNTGNTYTPSESTAGIHTYYATSTGANGCESLPTEIKLTIHALPAAPSTVGNSICEGETNTQISAMGTGVQWYDGSGNLLGAGNTYLPLPAVNTAGSYNYFASQTDVDGCESSQTLAVYKIVQVPAVPAFVDASLEACETETNPSFTVSGTNLQWYETAGGSVISTNNTYTSTKVFPGLYTYFVTQTVNGCESNTETGTLEILPMPLINNVSGGGAYCEGTGGVTITLDDSETGITYELWRDGSELITTLSGTTGSALNFNNITDAGTYTIDAYNALSLCKRTMNGGATVSVKPLPGDGGPITGSEIICQDTDGLTYTIDPVSDATGYVWNVPTGYTIVGGDNSSSITVNTDNTATDGFITVYAQNACGSGNPSANKAVTVNPVPEAAGAITGLDVICNDQDGVIYSISAVNNATTYVWDVPAGGTIVAGVNSRQITVDFNESTVADFISVYATNACGDGAVSSKYIDLNALPDVYAGLDQKTLCDDNTILTASSPDTDETGLWTVYSGAAVFANSALENTAVTNLSRGNNQLVYTITDNNTLCVNADTVAIYNSTVYVNAGNDIDLCQNSTSISANSLADGLNGTWSVVVGGAGIIERNSSATGLTDIQLGDNLLVWEVINNGCLSSDTIRISNNLPSTPMAGGSLNICSETYSLLAETPAIGTGRWSLVGGSGVFDDPTLPNATVSNLFRGENTLRWTVTNKECSLYDEIDVFNNQVDVDAGPTLVVCDRIADMNAVEIENSTGNWSVVSGSGSFDETTSAITRVASLLPDTNVFRWTVNIAGCLSSDTVIVVNNRPTTANAGSDKNIFEQGNLEGNAPVEGTGRWSVIDGYAEFDNITSPTAYISNVNPGRNIFRWTITKNGCISEDDVSILNESSDAPYAGPAQTLCNTNETQLNATAPEYGFGSWSVISGTVRFVDSEVHNTTAFDIAHGTNLLLWTVNVGGLEFYDTLTIVNNSPTLANAGVDQRLCTDSATLEGNASAYGVGRWVLLSGSATIADTSVYNTQVTNLGKGQNTFKWLINNNNCITTDEVQIYNDLPTVAEAGFDKITCEDSIVLNPNTPTFGVGSWSVYSGSATFSGNYAHNLAVGENKLRWTIVNNQCESIDTVKITSYKPTDANAGSDISICDPNYQLNGNPQNISLGETGEWSLVSGSGLISDFNLHNADVVGLSLGKNVFRWEIDNNGCMSYDEIIISYDYIEAIASQTQILCSDETYLSANNPSSGIGEWSIVGGSGTAIFEDSNSPNTKVSRLDRGTNILRWTIVNQSCISYADDTIINSNPSPAFAGIDRSICADSLTLAATPPSSDSQGEWIVLSGSGSFEDRTKYNSKANGLGPGSNTFRWTTTKGNCKSYDEVKLSNNLPIDTEAGQDQVLCDNTTILGANNPNNGIGIWSVAKGAAIFSDATSYTTEVSSLSADTVLLRWTVQNEQCSAYDEVSIVNNKPTVARAGADKVICDSVILLDANTPIQSTTSQWSLISGAGDFEFPSENRTKVYGLANGENTLRWTIIKNGCISFDDVKVTSNRPSVPDAGTSDTLNCYDYFELYANSPVFGSGSWSVINGSGVFDNINDYNTTIRGLGQGTNVLRWTISYNGCTESDVVTVVNNIRDVNAGEDQEVYENFTELVGNISNEANAVVFWDVYKGTGLIEDESNYKTDVINLSEGTNTFIWNFDINGCISNDTVQVTYYRMPSASYTLSDNQACPPIEVKFTRTEIEDYPFYWDFGDGVQSTVENPVHLYSESGVYKAKLVIEGPDGSDIVNQQIITIHEMPVAEFDFSPDTVFIAVSDYSENYTEVALQLYNFSIGGASFIWNFGDGQTSDEISPSHYYEEIGTYDIQLNTYSEFGCADSIIKEDIVTAVESGYIVAPTGFTPSLNGPGDGTYDITDRSNDVFFIIFEGVEEFHMEIYNRWGVRVFESTDMNIGWDGYIKNRIAPEGVYVYRVRVIFNNGRPHTEAGDFLLIHKGF